MSCYIDIVEREHAHQEGMLQDLELARENYCDGFLREQLAGIKKSPVRWTLSDIALWPAFAERQGFIASLDAPLSRMLAECANMSDADIANLRTVSNTTADAFQLMRDDIHNMLLEEAGGLFDTAAQTGNWEAL